MLTKEQIVHLFTKVLSKELVGDAYHFPNIGEKPIGEVMVELRETSCEFESGDTIDIKVRYLTPSGKLSKKVIGITFKA